LFILVEDGVQRLWGGLVRELGIGSTTTHKGWLVMVVTLCSATTIGLGEISLRIKFPRLFDLAVNRETSVEEMERLGWADGGGAWVWTRRLLAWEEKGVRGCSDLLHNIVLQEQVLDKWKWLLDPIHCYLVHGVYRFITTSDEPVVRNLADDDWHKHIPLKVSLFVRRLLCNRLPTKDNLVQKSIL